MAAVLYYDKDDKVLWVQDGDQKYPLYTYANLNTENTRLTEEGYLQVKDGNSESDWYDVLGPNQTQISLKGPRGKDGEKGDPGEPGKDGKSSVSFHLEISNDADQIYVDENNKVKYEQDDVQTSVTLYQDGELVDFDEDSGWKIRVYIKEDPKKQKPNNVEYSQETKLVSFSHPVGAFIEKDTLVYTIEAYNDLEKYDLITKDFKLKRLVGSVDYDLHVSKRVIKLSPAGVLSDISKTFTVQVKSKELGKKSSAIYLSPNQLPIDYTVWYQWSDEVSSYKVDSDSIDISKKIFNTQEGELPSLFLTLKHSTLGEIDRQVIECVRDGKDGTANHIELSDDFNQIYVLNNIPIANQPAFETVVTYFVGTDQQAIVPEDIMLGVGPYSDYFNLEKHQVESGLGVKLKLTVKENAIFPLNVTTLKIPIICHSTYEKTYTIVKINGTKDYDLWVDPDYMQCIQDQKGESIIGIEPQVIKIKVTETDLSANEIKKGNFINKLPDDYYLTYTINGETHPVPQDSGYEDVLAELNIMSLIGGNYQDIPRKISIELYQNNTLVDWSEVAILRDGKKGDKGEDGASAYYLDVINDFDQIYVYNGELFTGQQYNTDFYLYKGAQKISQISQTLPNIVEVIPEQDFGQIIINIDEFGKGHLTIYFDDPEKTFDTETKSLSYKLHVKQQTQDGQVLDLNKIIRISVLTSADDYDLHLSQSAIHKDAQGELKHGHEDIYISIKHRNLSAQGQGVQTLDTVEQLKAGGRDLTLYYSIDGEALSILSCPQGSALKLDRDLLKQAKEFIQLRLTDGSVTRDEERILVTQDGENAKPYILDLSNDLDSVYVDESGYLFEDSSVTTWATLYDGMIPVENEKVSYSVVTSHQNVGETIKCDQQTGEITIQLSKSIAIPKEITRLEYTLQAVLKETGTAMQKRFKINVFTGNTSTQLRVGSSVIRKDVNNVYYPSKVRCYVDQQTIGLNSSETQEIDWESAGYQLMYNINNDDESTTRVLCTKGKDGYYGDIITQGLFDNYTNPTLNIRLEKVNHDDDITLVQMQSLNVVSDGKNGEDAVGYVVDFSNDSDQFYVDEAGKLYSDQTVTTGIKVYKGTTELQAYDDWTIEGSLVDASQASLIDDISLGLDKDNNCYTLSIAALSGATVQSGVQTISYLITVYAGNSVITKKYKILIFKNNSDYDVHSTHSHIKKSKDGTFHTDVQDVSVWVTKKTLGQNVQTQPIELKEANQLSSEGLTFKYELRNMSDVPIAGFTVNSTTNPNLAEALKLQDWNEAFTDSSNSIYVGLYSNSVEIDHLRLDCIEDGQDGQSPVIVNLTNDSDQVYTLDGKVREISVVSTTIEVYQNGTKLSDVDIYVKEDNDAYATTPLSSSTWNKTYTLGTSLTADKKFTFKVTKKGNTNVVYGEKTFTVRVIEDAWDYDLVVPSTLVFSKNNAYKTDLSFSISKRTVGTKSTASETLTAVPASSQVSWKAYNSSQTQVGSGTLEANSSCSIAKASLPTNAEYFTLTLTMSGSTRDVETVPVLKEAKDGNPGQNATSAYIKTQDNILYISDPSNYPLGQQTLTYTIGASEGSTAKQITSNFYIINQPANGWQIDVFSSDLSTDKLSCTISLIFTSDYDDCQPGTYLLTIGNGTYSLDLPIIVQYGDVFYDLVASPNCIKINSNQTGTNRYTQIEFKVFKTCSGGGYTEKIDASDLSGYNIYYSTGTGSDTQLKKTNNKWVFKPTSDASYTFKCTKSANSGYIYDFLTLAPTYDGMNGQIDESFQVKTGTTVTGGFTGKSGTSAFIWGGGTADQAENAASNNYYLSGTSGNKIPTLIKRDGTGKIGPFIINDTDVEIFTSSGKVVIDSDDGITVFDSDDVPRVKMTTNSISNYIPIIGTVKTASMVYKSTDSWLPTTGQRTMVIDGVRQTVNITAITPKSASIEYSIEATFYKNNTVGKELYGEIYIPYTVYMGSTTRSLSAMFTVNEYDFRNTDQVTRSQTQTIESFSAPNWPRYEAGSVVINDSSVTQVCDGVTVDYSCSYVTTVDYTLSYQVVSSSDPITVIGSDGLLCVKDASTYFQVLQDSTNQKVVFAGLPSKTNYSFLPIGGLYQENGVVKIKQS